MFSKSVHPFYKSWSSHASKYFENKYEYKSRFELFNNEQFKGLFRNAPGVILVVNHIENKYEFFSENIKSLIGYSAEEFYTGHVPFGMSLVYEEHSAIFSKFIFPHMFRVIDDFRKTNEIKNIRMTYSFKMKRKDGQYIWVQQHMSILDVDIDGNPVLSLYFMYDINDIKKDNQIDFTVSKLSQDGYFVPMVIINYPSSTVIDLSRREIEILAKLGQGKSSKKIAEELCISYFTVQTHRKNMLSKTGCKNTAALLRLASVKGLS